MSAKRINSPTDGLHDDTGFDNAAAVVTAGATDSGSAGGGKHGGPLVTSYISGDPTVDDLNEFNIQINFSGSKWTPELQADAIAAANAWCRIITGDIGNALDLKGNLVDDIVIDLSIGHIDGLGSARTGVNTLATTGNWVVRDPGTPDQLLPLTASTKLDAADLKNPDLAGLWPAIIMHEMGHALGFFGGLFQAFGLLDTATQTFVGTHAVLAYGGDPVPLSSDFSHWSETAFSPNGTPQPADLMTTLFALGQEPVLSDTTIAAFADLGYTVLDPLPGTLPLHDWLV